MTHAQMMNMMSAGELTYWQAYSSIEPFGEERADLRMGILASLIANVNRKKGSKAYKPEQFMPKFYKTVEGKLTKEGLALKAETLRRILSRK